MGSEARIITTLAILQDCDEEREEEFHQDQLFALQCNARLKTAARLTTKQRLSFNSRNRLKRKFRYQLDARGKLMQYLHRIFVDVQNLFGYACAGKSQDSSWIRFALTGHS